MTTYDDGSTSSDDDDEDENENENEKSSDRGECAMVTAAVKFA